jgi:hypothetical protein
MLRGKGDCLLQRTGASSPSLIMRTTSHRAHGRPESAPAAAPARTALAMIRRAEPKAQIVTIARWQVSGQLFRRFVAHVRRSTHARQQGT